MATTHEEDAEVCPAIGDLGSAGSNERQVSQFFSRVLAHWRYPKLPRL